MPGISTTPSPKSHSEIDDDLDISFEGMVTFCNVTANVNSWIIDSGASDHMTAHANMFHNYVVVHNLPRINFPNGALSSISKIGDIILPNSLVLKNVLFVPSLKHNLLSVTKLSQDNNCQVILHPDFCVIRDNTNYRVKGISRQHNGLYYFLDVPVESIDLNSLPSAFGVSIDGNHVGSSNMTSVESYTMWHNRFGHAPTLKLKQIPEISADIGSYDCTCITCPMAKFVKQPCICFEHVSCNLR